MKEKLETLLSGVKQNRRDMLKKMLLGTGALALAPLSSVVHAQDDPAAKGKGKGKRGGKGKGKSGKGKGKGKGKGRRR